jgi:hypothetical protein
MPGGDLIRAATRVTTDAAVAATELVVASIERTGRVVKRLLPGGRGER